MGEGPLQAAPEETAAEMTPENGVPIKPTASVATLASAKKTVSHPMKMIASRVPGIILALVAINTDVAQIAVGGDWFSTVLWTVVFPFRYGLVLTSVAMGLQVMMMLFYNAWHCDCAKTPEPRLDPMGTLLWEPEGETSKKLIAIVRALTTAFLGTGLALTLVALGVQFWIVFWPCVAAVVIPLLPPETRQIVFQVAREQSASLLARFGSVTSFFNRFLKERQQTKKPEAVQPKVEKQPSTLDSSLDETPPKDSQRKSLGSTPLAPKAKSANKASAKANSANKANSKKKR